MALISYVTRIHFADAVLEEAIAAERSTLALRRPLVVTDRGLVAVGLVERLLDALKGAAVSVFDATPAQLEILVADMLAAFEKQMHRRDIGHMAQYRIEPAFDRIKILVKNDYAHLRHDGAVQGTYLPRRQVLVLAATQVSRQLQRSVRGANQSADFVAHGAPEAPYFAIPTFPQGDVESSVRPFSAAWFD